MRTKTLVQDKYGWYKPTAQRQQKTVLSKDIEAQNAKTIEKTKKKQKKQYSRGLGIGALPKEFVNIVFFCFFWFFQCFFGFSLRGPPQRVCKYCFFCFFLVFPMFFWFFFKGSYLICFFVVIVLPFPSNDPSLTV